MEASSGVNYNEEEEDYDELAAAASVVNQMPPGFRFHPTDSEIIDYYLLKKVMDRWFQAVAVGEIDLNKCEPWDLPQKAKMGEKEWFFFFEKETKYPSGMRTNRATPWGYWKATGKDKEIYNAKKRVIGMKKTLVFYKGRAPKGEKMNWVIHEYRLHGDYSAYNLSAHAKEKWVVCKVFHKNNQVMRTNNPADVDGYLLDSPAPVLPPLTDYSEKPSSIDQFKASTLMLNNNITLQHNNLLFPQQMINNSYNLQYSAPQMLHLNYHTPSPSVVYQHQDTTNGADRIYIGGKEADHQRMCMESTNGSESKRACDEEVEVEALGFSPNISDLDSLWSY